LKSSNKNKELSEKFSGVTLARLLRARGLRGEVAAEILTDFPERLPKLRDVWLAGGQNPPRHFRVRKCWLSPSRGGQAVFHFEGIDDCDAADTLRGLEVQVPIEDRAPIPAGSYFVSDLVGCAVWEPQAAEPLGSVRDVEFPGGVPLLAIDTERGEVLIPLASEYCLRIDVDAKRIDVLLPRDLRDLNRS
jgi:16S rRNA processing protein RimM